MPIDEAVASLLATMSKGQYLLLAEAVRQLGGELRISPAVYASAIDEPSPRMQVDASDGALVPSPFT